MASQPTLGSDPRNALIRGYKGRTHFPKNVCVPFYRARNPGFMCMCTAYSKRGQAFTF